MVYETGAWCIRFSFLIHHAQLIRCHCVIKIHHLTHEVWKYLLRVARKLYLTRAAPSLFMVSINIATLGKILPYFTCEAYHIFYCTNPLLITHYWVLSITRKSTPYCDSQSALWDSFNYSGCIMRFILSHKTLKCAMRLTLSYNTLVCYEFP